MGEENMNEPGEAGPWPSETMRRNMEFIIQQQAQFAPDMQRLGETQSRAEQRWGRTEESIRALLAAVRRRQS